MSSEKIIRIPEDDVILNQLEVAVLQTSVFQRLFNLKQLGLAYLVYPFATHTRAAHSIQTLNEAHRLLQALKTNHCDVSEMDEAAVRLAALLHDIAHIPFSHTLEDEHLVLEKHDKVNEGLGRLYILLDQLEAQLVLRDSRAVFIEARKILTAVCTKNKQDWRSDIIGSTVCADLLAYIQADAMFTGISKRPGHYRIYQYFTIETNRLCIKITKKGAIRTDVISAIMDILDMRYALTERVLFHHAKCVASSMLARAARLANLREPSFEEAKKDFPKLYQIGEESFYDYLQDLSATATHASDAEGVSLLLDHLRTRRLYKRIYKIGWQGLPPSQSGFFRKEPFYSHWRNPKNVEDLLCRIENDLDMPRGALVLWCPEGKASMKLAKSNVTWDRVSNNENEDIPQPPLPLNDPAIKAMFPGIAQRVEAIQEQYRALWTFWVAVAPAYADKAAAIRDLLKNALKVDCDPYFLESHPQQFQQDSLPY